MVKNFFDLVNPNFFNPFTSKYKEIHFDLLRLINERMNEEGLQFEKSIMIDVINEYFKTCPNIDLLVGEDDSDFSKSPSDFIRYFTKCGWMSYEMTSDFKEMYQMDPVALDILEAMQGVIDDDNSPLESSGYVYSIYKNLAGFETNKATETAEQISIASKKLSSNLRSITAKIKKYLDNLLKKDNQNPEKILYELLSNYQNNVVRRSFNNLRTRDNPSKYKEAILSSINHLRDDYMDELVANYIDVKFNGVASDDNKEEAEVFFLRLFQDVKKQFESISSMIDALEGRNTQYVTSATSRVTFLLNDKNNLEGKIDKILRTFEDKKVRASEEFEFTSHQLKRIDSSSLYMHTHNRKPDPSIIEEVATPMSEEEILKYEENLKRLSLFTIRGVDNFIMDALGDKESIQANEIKLNNFDDFMMLFLACIYKQSSAVRFDIESSDGVVNFEDRILENFTIIRRPEK